MIVVVFVQRYCVHLYEQMYLYITMQQIDMGLALVAVLVRCRVLCMKTCALQLAVFDRLQYSYFWLLLVGCCRIFLCKNRVGLSLTLLPSQLVLPLMISLESSWTLSLLLFSFLHIPVGKKVVPDVFVFLLRINV